MSTEVLVGVIGLSGAVIGAAAAFAGVVYQQRHQAKMARAERRDRLAETAVDTLIAELEKLSELVWMLPPDEEESADWKRAVNKHIAAIALAVLRLPDRDLRLSIEAAGIVGFGRNEQFQEHVGLHATQILMNAMCRDAQNCLGAYLRQEPMPDTAFLSQAYPFYRSMITVLPPSQ